MANYEANQMLVAVKAYTRGNPLSLDASETWESLSEAQTYAKSSIAYAGQTIKAKLEDGKYHQYILQPGDSGYTLEEVGAVNPSDLKQYVIVGTRPGSGQEQGVIYIDNNVGYIWSGSDWVKVFEDVSSNVSDFTVLGETVDAVERIENICSEFGKTIIVTQNTLDKLDVAAKTEYLGQIRLKNSNTKIKIFELISMNQND